MIWLILGISAVTLVIALWLVTQINGLKSQVSAVPKDGNVVATLQHLDVDLTNVEKVVAEMEPRLGALEARVPLAISHTGVVAYDAFGDISGNLSRSIAMLNDRGDGFVISLLVGRSESLFYTKQVRGRTGVEPLSPEEEDAVARAMAAAR